ncbi:MAG TPA: 2Fe-2S iron-sulfur cluster-binding protein [Herpetosiphonaceae bacterium]
MSLWRVHIALPDGSTATVMVGADEYILDAAARAGLVLPSLCRQGWCIACAARLCSGEVDQTDALRYYPQDRAAGFVLLCTARPRSDLSIVSHQSEALRRHRDACGLPAPRGT